MRNYYICTKGDRYINSCDTEYKSIIDGKQVLGPKDEIQEVKNAYNAYNLIKEVDCYSVKDLKKIQGIITYLLDDESGNFRKGNEGVFDEKGNCIHICPPPEQVERLMQNFTVGKTI